MFLFTVSNSKCVYAVNYIINHILYDWLCTFPIDFTSRILSKVSAIILSESQAGLQNSLNKLEKYCYKWQLTVNTNKTKIMIFQGSNHSYSFFFYRCYLPSFGSFGQAISENIFFCSADQKQELPMAAMLVNESGRTKQS